MMTMMMNFGFFHLQQIEDVFQVKSD